MTKISSLEARRISNSNSNSKRHLVILLVPNDLRFRKFVCSRFQITTHRHLLCEIKMPHTLTSEDPDAEKHTPPKILNEKCRKRYENIYVICPTFSINSTWQGWKFRNGPGVKVLKTHDVNRAIKEILGRHKKGRALIIFDDVATSKDVKSQTSELVKLGFSGRHHGIDTIILTQQLTWIAKAYRENITFLVTFYTPGKRDMKVIVDDFLDPDADATKIRKQLRDIPYARLEISLESPYGWTVKNS